MLHRRRRAEGPRLGEPSPKLSVYERGPPPPVPETVNDGGGARVDRASWDAERRSRRGVPDQTRSATHRADRGGHGMRAGGAHGAVRPRARRSVGGRTDRPRRGGGLIAEVVVVGVEPFGGVGGVRADGDGGRDRVDDEAGERARVRRSKGATPLPRRTTEPRRP